VRFNLWILNLHVRDGIEETRETQKSGRKGETGRREDGKMQKNSEKRTGGI